MRAKWSLGACYLSDEFSNLSEKRRRSAALHTLVVVKSRLEGCADMRITTCRSCLATFDEVNKPGRPNLQPHRFCGWGARRNGGMP